MNPHQALMFAKQQQQFHSQRSLLGTGSTQDQNHNDQHSSATHLNFSNGQSLINQGLSQFGASQAQGSFTNRGPGQGLDAAFTSGMPTMGPNLLAMIGGSNSTFNLSGRSLLSTTSALNGTDNNDTAALTAAFTNASDAPRETSGNAALSSGSRTSTIIPNPSAMDIPNQNIAALLTEETAKNGKSKGPGYVSGPSKSKVSTNTNVLPPVLRGKYVTKQPNCHDVLCGRGNFVNNHEGNKHFREIVALHKVMYVAAPKHSKPIFARKIIDTLHSLSPPGHFLAQEPSTKLWYELDNKKAMSKTRQALREGAPQIMKTIVDASTEVREADNNNADEDSEPVTKPKSSRKQRSTPKKSKPPTKEAYDDEEDDEEDEEVFYDV